MVLAVLLRESMTNLLSHANLFSDLSNVTLRRVFKTDQGWTIEADGQDSAICPGCQSVSRSRHSRYWRSLQDLPIQGTPVILRVHVGRRRCRKVASGESFAERPLNVCAPHARQTKRSDEIIAVVGRALGGRPGQRLMGRLGMPFSADTLIRRVKGAARWSALLRVIRVLGVDDWVTRRVARTASRSDHGQPRSPRSLRRGRPSRRTRSSPSSGSLSLGSKPPPKRWNVNLLSIGGTFESPPRAHRHYRYPRQQRK